MMYYDELIILNWCLSDDVMCYVLEFCVGFIFLSFGLNNIVGKKFRLKKKNKIHNYVFG